MTFYRQIEVFYLFILTAISTVFEHEIRINLEIKSINLKTLFLYVCEL